MKKNALQLFVLLAIVGFSRSAPAQISYGPILYQDDFSTSNSLWRFTLLDTQGNQAAMDASYGKIEGGVLTLKANIGCGWDFLSSVASLQFPLPTNYVIEYRARKMQWCGAFRTDISQTPGTVGDSHLNPPAMELSMAGNWFGQLCNFRTWDDTTCVPPTTGLDQAGTQINGQWYNYRIVKGTKSFRVYVNGNLQWSYSGSVLPGGYLHIGTGGAGSTAEVDDLTIYGINQSLEIEVAAVRLRFFAEANKLYQLQSSTQFQNWTNIADVFGNGTATNFIDWTDSEKKFYRLVETGNLNDGLVLFYPFNGNAHDESGNGNDGIVTGATLGTNRFGISSNSYGFTATGDYPSWIGTSISTANSNGFPTSTQDFSVSVWASLALFGPDYHVIFANREVNQFQLGIGVFADTNAPIEFYSGFGLVAPSLQSAPVGWTLGRWYNIQLTRAANVVTIYRDGVALAQGTVTTGNSAAPDNLPLDFGWRTLPGAGNHPLWGGLDDVRIYSRALNSAEVQALFRLAD